MKVSPKKMRKMLNKAWDDGKWWGLFDPTYSSKKHRHRRYRDVSKIFKEAEAKQRKDERDENTV